MPDADPADALHDGIAGSDQAANNVLNMLRRKTGA